MPYELRQATAADAPAIRNLIFEILEAYGLAASPETTDADLFDLDGFYFEAGGDFAVVVDGSTLIGCVGLLRLDDDVCELRKMYVDWRYRGLGLGKQLLDYAISRAIALGFRQITLETASVLKEAIALYERYGFRAYVPEHLAARCDRAMTLDLTRLQ